MGVVLSYKQYLKINNWSELMNGHFLLFIFMPSSLNQAGKSEVKSWKEELQGTAGSELPTWKSDGK